MQKVLDEKKRIVPQYIKDEIFEQEGRNVGHDIFLSILPDELKLFYNTPYEQ